MSSVVFFHRPASTDFYPYCPTLSLHDALPICPSFGEWLSFDEIPPIMREAMVAVEDRRFRSHPGVDPIGIARALKVRVDRGSWVQGGSTITQQLARNIFLTNNRTFGRKVKEAILALALEQRFTKDQNLALYLNRVYFGGERK